jgi:hypothetical protein
MAFENPPIDPTVPRDPMVIKRRRPDSVTWAGVFMYVAAGLGVISSGALLAAAGGVVDGFRGQADDLGASRSDIESAAMVIRSALFSSGLGALVLAVITGVLAYGVLRRSEAARIGALVVMAGSFGCALVRTSVTAFGRNIEWTAGIENATASVTHDISQAYGDAMPSWLVGLGGGLTDLQALGYIAVAVLLLHPASQEYFRTRQAISRPSP